MRQRKDPTRKAAKNLGNVKIEATASDGAENASDHFVTSFLVFGGIEKAELLFEAPPELVYTLFCFIGMIPSTWITKNIGILSKRLMLV